MAPFKDRLWRNCAVWTETTKRQLSTSAADVKATTANLGECLLSSDGGVDWNDRNGRFADGLLSGCNVGRRGT